MAQAQNSGAKRSGTEIAKFRIADWRLGLGDRRPWLTRPGDGLAEHNVFVLDLRGLGLTSVPSSLGGIPRIDVLDLSANDISELPGWFFTIPANIINLSGNALTKLPASIGQTQAISLLFDHNALEELPESLQDTRLQYLSLRGNPALRIPESILNPQNPAELLQYYFESRRDSEPLLEMKLMLVGRGKAGKTSLVKRLAGEAPDATEPETHSIAIRELPIETSRGTVRTRAWDFGGQEILHSTHQFFLTERSLYLLVLEPRTGQAQRDAEYWLKLIEAQGGGSPAIVVMNWSRGHRWHVDQVKLRRKFPFIVDFISTDAMHGDGIEALQAAIVATAEERMTDVWLPFPRRWRAIKDAVAGMSDNFLTFEQYAALCAAHEEADPQRQADLAGILHALGLALYFGRDRRLHDTRVLNPDGLRAGCTPSSARTPWRRATANWAWATCRAC